MLLGRRSVGVVLVVASLVGAASTASGLEGDVPAPSTAETAAPAKESPGMTAPAVATPDDSYAPVLSEPAIDQATALAAREGSVRIIVSLDVPWAPEGDLTTAGRQAQRARLKAAQQDLLNLLEPYLDSGDRSNLIWRYDTTPELALELEPDALDALLESGLAAQVDIDVATPPNLVQSVPFVIEDLNGARSDGLDGSGVVVAILDTGVDGSHPFISGKIVAEACFSSGGDCPNGLTSQVGVGAGAPCDYADACSHGTHVAGIAAGSLTAGECAAAAGEPCEGVAPGAQVVAIQVFSMFTGGSCGTGPDPCPLSYTSDQKAALDHIASSLGALPIAAANVSIGGGQSTETCDGDSRATSVLTLESMGIATVISAGNDGYTTATGAPACISSAVTVGATTETGVIPTVECSLPGFLPFSFYTNSDEHVDLFAPGGWYCNPNGTDGRPGSLSRSSVVGDVYAGYQGTSMAAPHVTGAFALLHQVDPALTVDEAVDFLRDSGSFVVDTRPKSDAATLGQDRWAALLHVPSCVTDVPTCLAGPPNDDFTQALDLAANPCGPSSGCHNYLADKQTGEPNHAGYTGGNSVWFKWTAPASGTISVSTAGSGFDTLLGVYTGATIGSLSALASNDDDPAGGSTSAIGSVPVSAGTTYRIAVDGFPAASYTDARPTDLAGAGRVQIALSFTPSSIPLPPPDPADEVLFYRSTDGTFKYYDLKSSGVLSQLLANGKYSLGWDSITGIDLGGDGDDEQLFYRSTDGTFKYYAVRPDGTLEALLANGLYSLGWDSISAIDLGGDGDDEQLFYRSTDGTFKYYSVRSDGTLEALLANGKYSLGWDSITAVDLDGDGADEQLFYRSTDGTFKYYSVRSDGTLEALLANGKYSLGWDSITAVDVNGDGNDEIFFYRSTDGTFKYYTTKPNGDLGTLLNSGTYSLGWDSISAVDLDG